MIASAFGKRDDEENLDSQAERLKLLAPLAPYEPAAVLRAFDNGLRGPALVKALGMTMPQVAASLRISLEERDDAVRRGKKVVEFKVPRTMK